MQWIRSSVPVLVAAFLVLNVLPVGLAQDDTLAEEADRQTTTISFYGHLFGHGLDQPMPSNTQFPYGEDNYGLGTFDWCTPAGGMVLGGIPDPGHTCDNDPNNKVAFYSTAGFVQVQSGDEFRGAGGYEMLHNERGNAKDIVLDTTQSVTAGLYMSMDLHAWSVNAGDTYCVYPNPRDTGCLYPYWGWDPAFVPQFLVQACLYHAALGEYGSAASDMPPVRQALESGQAEVVACGETQPMDVTNGIPGEANVHYFPVDLGTPQAGFIPKEHDFFLVFSFYSSTPAGAASLHTWRIWSGEFFPPTFTLPVKNAFDVELVVPQFIHGKLAILGLISTPWGSYDVNPEATTITITDAQGNEIVPARMDAIADYKVAHGAHYKPVNVTFVWDYLADNLKPGTYTATISAENHQGSATATCSGRFTIKAGGAPGSVEVGECGLQTADTHKTAVGDESVDAASPGTHLLRLPGAGNVGIQSAAATAAVPTTTPLLAFAILALAGLFALRRWNS